MVNHVSSLLSYPRYQTTLEIEIQSMVGCRLRVRLHGCMVAVSEVWTGGGPLTPSYSR
jgi:hypothetical protein